MMTQRIQSIVSAYVLFIEYIFVFCFDLHTYVPQTEKLMDGIPCLYFPPAAAFLKL